MIIDDKINTPLRYAAIVGVKKIDGIAGSGEVEDIIDCSSISLAFMSINAEKMKDIYLSERNIGGSLIIIDPGNKGEQEQVGEILDRRIVYRYPLRWQILSLFVKM